MAENKLMEMEAEKQEVTSTEGGERTRECPCFMPRADIYEVDDQMVVVVDVPGVSEENIDVTVEKNVLTINAYVNPVEMEGFTPVWTEYEVGDYQRSFRLSDEIDRDNIHAAVKDGVLRLYLPKSKAARSRKIAVKAG